jgi:hypothetical protein
MQFYSNPERESDPYALPDCETFFADSTYFQDEYGEPQPAGWYWQACFPGCLPDSDPVGPFETEQEAIDDAQEAI